MAVHTKLTSEEISDLLKNYSIGNLLSYTEIIEGIDNSNFIIRTDQGKFILTIFENRLKKEQLPFFINLKLHLASQGIQCPKPLLNKNNSAISEVKNKAASIVSFLEGQSLKPRDDGYYTNITTANCAEVGHNLALLHLAVKNFSGSRSNDLGVKGFRTLFNKMQDNINKFEPELQNQLESVIDFLEKSWQENLPAGVVHADLFPDNVFFREDGKLSGIIDFYFAANDLFIYDLAIVVNAWCFNSANQLQPEKMEALIAAYDVKRKISDAEKAFFKIALVAAAMRFLLTRLYDYFNTPKESLVKIKDPNEYLEKLHFWLQ